ncbi:MutS-related protein [Salinisphaera sp. RV14]|uniref:MutS-related protein n=1 Tax=Salinisphaera sp. RV14 TaxID=3454140 RepID=UPI003F85322F
MTASSGGSSHESAAVFVSLLFENAVAANDCRDDVPEGFSDLNLDQVVAAIVGEQDQYGLTPLFYTPAPNVDTVSKRHAVFRDLENDAIRRAAQAFTDGVGRVHECRAHIDKAHHRHEKIRWLVDSAARYCAVVTDFASALTDARLESAGFVDLSSWLGAYVASDDFRTLAETTEARLADVDSIRYDVLIRGPRIEVSRFGDEPDYGEVIAATFERFRHGDAKERHQTFPESVVLNTVETRVLEQVTQLFPEIFERFETFYQTHADYIDDVVARIDRELQFCLHYRRYIASLEKAGLAFCYPDIVGPDEAIIAQQTFDLALAKQLVAHDEPVVTNDFELTPPERIILVSGPNQGGKTTFARMFGQLHWLARLGCPVPGGSARLMFWSGLFAHFERAEDIRNLRGKLEDDLVRVHAILERVDRESIVIMNEIFSSTTTDDARYLGERILRSLIEAGAAGVCVTFIDDLATLDEAIVSMASTVDADDPAIRTFQIQRKAPDGRAYARSLAEKHRLTREALEARL